MIWTQYRNIYGASFKVKVLDVAAEALPYYLEFPIASEKEGC
jgi:hypothetical protein